MHSKPVSTIQDDKPDLLLDGRVKLHQPATGYRAAIDPVLLAAACPAKVGEHVLDAGCGVGTAALCVLARVDARATGIEIQPHMAELARRNAAESGVENSFSILNNSILSSRGIENSTSYDHTICNPPYLPGGYGSGAPTVENHEGDAKLPDWVAFCANSVRPGGSVVFIHRADRLPELLAEIGRHLGAIAIFPLWPRAGEAAKRVIVGGIKGRRSAAALAAGLVLHRADGSFTPEADAILRNAAPLTLWPS